MLLQRKKANSLVPAIFFPHCMAFLEKREGLVLVYVFLFPDILFCHTFDTKLATPSACYRGPKPQKCPKSLGEGAKGGLDPGSKGLPIVFCTTQTLFCTGATLFCTSARGLCSLSPKDLLHPLLTTLVTFEVSDPCSRHSGVVTLNRKQRKIQLLGE